LLLQFSTEFFEVELQIGLEHNLPIGDNV
jgi:hypothetical protein